MGDLVSTMNIESVVAELRKKYESHLSSLGDSSYRMRPDQVVSEELEGWSVTLQLSRSEICDRIALFLARGFRSSQLSFGFCDAVVNDLFGAITLTGEAKPALFWKVYMAFDEGEYRHENDDAEVDPVEKYTRPMLAKIVSEHPDVQDSRHGPE